MKKYLFRASIVLALAVASLGFYVLPVANTMASAATHVTLYHNPGCMCCERYADYLDGSGYAVEVVGTHDMAGFNEAHGVPRKLASCHTMVIGAYIVVGHVPADVIDKLLPQRPAIRGISLPGMPPGSPGMGGEKRQPFVIRTVSGKIFTIY